MASSLVPRILLRRPILTTTGVVSVGGLGYVNYSNDPAIRGVRRTAYFWSQLVPVVSSYYWYFGSRSPYVKYRQWMHPQEAENENQKKMMDAEKKQLLLELHARHSTRLLDVMLHLGSLYIKLGQVLSVTMLPVPEAYREKFRTLQSNVSNWEDKDTIVRILEKEWKKPIDEVLESLDDTPCGAASIGQAHRAVTKNDQQTIILKVQYPDASWQVPADIQCVKTLLDICVWTGVVDETSSKMGFDDFSRQFLSELDYLTEQQNLREIYESSLDKKGPYVKHGVVVPEVLPELCSPRIIAMTFLPGTKLEEEAHRRLKRLGIDTKRNPRQLVAAGSNNHNHQGEEQQQQPSDMPPSSSRKIISKTTEFLGINRIMTLVRSIQTLANWYNSVVGFILGLSPVKTAATRQWLQEQRARREAPTEAWINALLDVHGHQIFQLGLFNGDPHPGNILVDPDDLHLGLIDFGQCKRLTFAERQRIAKLVVSVATRDSDEKIAEAFRGLGIRTRNDSTEFLAEFARLMWGDLQARYLDHDWHQTFHKQDKVDHFPPELGMVYRNVLLLRGLALSLQQNPSIAEHWLSHAERVLLEELPEDTTTAGVVVNHTAATNNVNNNKGNDLPVHRIG